ncbi:hypothetical protein ACH45F_03260 [Catenuloplanes sp. NPDC020197]|uniref:Uncharacterized protein n=1 Tax=Catenuloplanes niger TaxID=587534 RepID=A0AAE4A298_9ACTN|nr:hypothetical protein [Catenuloplanes niger]MDR7327900.1 hypothetical protein [Catenuloplanes niger]
MSDLRQYLDRIAGPEHPPAPGTVDSDVTRGRVALRRKRQVHGLLGGALALVAVGALGVAVVTAGPPAERGGDRIEAAPSAAPATPGGTASAVDTGGASGVRLVAFAGDQPEGFTIDMVPEGWEIQSSVATTLLIAPIGLPDRNPDSFANKITVSLQDEAPGAGVPGEQVTVAGRPAALWTSEDGVRTLFVPLGDGAYLNVQLWNNLRWDTATIAEFAAGITVTDDVQRSRG